MKISKDSQLGLRLYHGNGITQALADRIMAGNHPNITSTMVTDIVRRYDAAEQLEPSEASIMMDLLMLDVMLDGTRFKHYLISVSAREMAKRVNVTDDIDFKLLDAIKPHSACYLLGQREMIRVIVGSSPDGGGKSDHVIFLHLSDPENNGKLKVVYATMTYAESLKDMKGSEAIESAKHMLQLLIFINLGEIETIRLLPGASKLRGIRTYKNQTGTEVTYVNSRWNTVVVRGEEFAVSGHLRLQAWGTGWQKRRLVWISSHKRKGYERSAGKTLSK